MQQLWDTLQALGSDEMAAIGLLPFLAVMVLSLASSLFVAYLYQTFYRSRATGSLVHHSFPLLGISITAIFISVQFSLPLSLGLLGALSIVRFRTPIKEPEEIGFVLLVIAASLCAATFNLGFLAVLLIVAVTALLLMKRELPWLKRRSGDGIVLVAMPADPGTETVQSLLQLLGQRLPSGRVDSVTESDLELSVTASFVQLAADELPALRADILGIVGDARTSFVFHQPGDV